MTSKALSPLNLTAEFELSSGAKLSSATKFILLGFLDICQKEHSSSFSATVESICKTLSISDKALLMATRELRKCRLLQRRKKRTQKGRSTYTYRLTESTLIDSFSGYCTSIYSNVLFSEDYPKEQKLTLVQRLLLYVVRCISEDFGFASSSHVSLISSLTGIDPRNIENNLKTMEGKSHLQALSFPSLRHGRREKNWAYKPNSFISEWTDIQEPGMYRLKLDYASISAKTLLINVLEHQDAFNIYQKEKKVELKHKDEILLHRTLRALRINDEKSLTNLLDALPALHKSPGKHKHNPLIPKIQGVILTSIGWLLTSGGLKNMRDHLNFKKQVLMLVESLDTDKEVTAPLGQLIVQMCYEMHAQLEKAIQASVRDRSITSISIESLEPTLILKLATTGVQSIWEHTGPSDFIFEAV
mgnify:CR=1 FL=1